MTTERVLLDALHRRLEGGGSNGGTWRHVLAEHPRSDPTYGGSIADAVSLDTWGSSGYALTGYEIKVSRSDWLREVRDPTKSYPWRSVCTWWWLVTIPGVCRDDLPHGWGLLELRGTRLVMAHHAPRNPEPLRLGPRPLAGLLRSTQQTYARRNRSPAENAILDRYAAEHPDPVPTPSGAPA